MDATPLLRSIPMFDGLSEDDLESLANALDMRTYTAATETSAQGGIRYVTDGAITDSIVMRSRSGTVRRIEARHKLSKLTHFTGREY